MTINLHLTNPLMHGPVVRSAQERLVKHGFMAAKYVDGYFGSHTAYACQVAKFREGYPKLKIKPTYGDFLDGILKGTIKLPKEYQNLKSERQGLSYKDFLQRADRQKVVSNALWGAHNTYAIHYQQLRPIDGTHHPFKLPLYIDCSGFVTVCFEWADLPDPNGLGYNGEGFTGTLLEHMHPIMKSMVEPADIVVWGNYPGHHTAIVIEKDDDPLLVSHGGEGDPRIIRFSVESRYQPSTVHWLRLPEWV